MHHDPSSQLLTRTAPWLLALLLATVGGRDIAAQVPASISADDADAEEFTVRHDPFPELRDPDWVVAMTELGLNGDSEFVPGVAVELTDADKREQMAQRLYFRASYQFASEQFDTALQTFRNALEYSPENTMILLSAAEAELELDAPANTIELCERVIALKPDDPEAWLLLGSAHRELRDAEAAISAFERALELRPNSRRILEETGSAYFGVMRVDEGIEIFERLVAIEPSNLRGLFYLSFGYQTKGDIDRAVATINEAIEYYPGHPPLHEFQLNLLLRAGRNEAFREKIREAIIVCSARDPFIAQYNQFLIGSAGDGVLMRVFQRPNVAETLARAFNHPPVELGEIAASPLMAQVAMALLPEYADFAEEYSDRWFPQYYEARLRELAGEIEGSIVAYRRAIDAGVRQGRLRLRVGELLLSLARHDEAEEEFRAAIEAEPFWGTPYLELGRLKMRTFRYEEALEVFSQGLVLEPTNVDLALMRAETEQLLGNTDRAISVLNDALTRTGANPRIYREMAHAFLLLDRSDLARRNLQRAVELDPDNLDITTDLLRLQLEAGDEDADTVFEEVATRDFGGVQPAQTRRFLWMLLRHAEIERTIRVLERLLESNPPRADIALTFLVELLERYPAESKAAGARRLGDAILDQISPRSLKTLAELKLRALLGDPTGAIAGYEQALRAEEIPTYSSIVELVEVMEQEGRLDEALRWLTEPPVSVGPAERALLDIRRLEFLFRTGRGESAERHIRAMLSAQPDSTALKRDLASVLHGADRDDFAERLYREVLEAEPDDSTTLNNLGYLLATQNRRLDEAERLTRRALELQPETGFIMDSLGWVFYQRGEYESAVRYLEAARRLSEWDAELYDHLGDAYSKLGNVDRARSYYRRALNLDPSNESISNKLQELDQ